MKINLLFVIKCNTSHLGERITEILIFATNFIWNRYADKRHSNSTIFDILCARNLFLCFAKHNIFLFLLSSMFKLRRKYWKIFDFRFLMDLHVLRYPQHDLTIFRKCLSVCMSPKFF